jgi:hypothetical protein
MRVKLHFFDVCTETECRIIIYVVDGFFYILYNATSNILNAYSDVFVNKLLRAGVFQKFWVAARGLSIGKYKWIYYPYSSCIVGMLRMKIVWNKCILPAPYNLLKIFFKNVFRLHFKLFEFFFEKNNKYYETSYNKRSLK